MVQARQQRVAEKGRALMQRFCQAFASAGGWGERGKVAEDVDGDDSGVVCLSCQLLMRCAGGRLDWWRRRRCGLDVPAESEW